MLVALVPGVGCAFVSLRFVFLVGVVRAGLCSVSWFGFGGCLVVLMWLGFGVGGAFVFCVLLR